MIGHDPHADNTKELPQVHPLPLHQLFANIADI